MKILIDEPFAEPVPWIPSEVDSNNTWLQLFYILYSVSSIVVIAIACLLLLTETTLVNMLHSKLRRVRFTRLAKLEPVASPHFQLADPPLQNRKGPVPSSLNDIIVNQEQLDQRIHSTSFVEERFSTFPTTFMITKDKVSEPDAEKQSLNEMQQLCATCALCHNGSVCRRFYWEPLMKLQCILLVYVMLSILFGLLVIICTTVMTFLPRKTNIQTSHDDKVLTFLKNICPEWSLAVYFVSHLMVSLTTKSYVSQQMKKLQTSHGLLKPMHFTARLCLSLLGISILLCFGLFECIVFFAILLSNQEAFTISIMWRCIEAILWIYCSVVTYCAFYYHWHIVQKDTALFWRFFFKATNKLVHDSMELDMNRYNVHDKKWSEMYHETKSCLCCTQGILSKDGVLKSTKSPFESARWYSRLIFSWMNPLLSLGFARTLNFSDLYDIPVSQKAWIAEREFNAAWEEEKAQRKHRPSLLRASFRYCKNLLLRTAFLKFLYDTLNFSNPFFLKYYMVFLDRSVTQLYKSPESSSNVSSTGLGQLVVHGLFIVFLMGLVNSVETFVLQRYFFLLYLKGMQFRAGLISVVYSKALRAAIETLNDEKAEAKPECWASCFCKTSICYHQRYISNSSSHGSTSQASRTSNSSNNQSTPDQQEKKFALKETNVISTGNVINLMSVDAQRVLDCLPYLHVLWSGLYQIAIALTLLWFQMGISMVSGVAVMLISVPVTLVLARRLKKIQEKLMRCRDERVKQTTEVFSFIKIVKLYAWEQSFENKISEIRDREVTHLRLYLILTVCQQLLWIGVPVLVSLVTFFTYVQLNNELTAAQAFTTITLFQYLAFPLGVFPNSISLALEARIALKRIQEFLLRPEIPALPTPVPITNVNEPSIVVKNVSLSWTNGAPLLSDLNLSCFPGTVTAVLGKTAVGKTGLLLSLIGEILPDASRSAPDFCFLVRGRIAYVSQIPWIQNDTLRNNILFGLDYEPTWYHQVLFSCCLLDDISILPSGDFTEIGENGVNLSGGQKQRVALARAVYQCARKNLTSSQHSADIVILDDCLSAVDAHVAQHIFHHCILGLLKKNMKTVVLATHHTKILPQIDQLVLLDKQSSVSPKTHNSDYRGGFILQIGTHQEFLQSELPLYINLLRASNKSDTLESQQQQDQKNTDQSQKSSSYNKQASELEKKLTGKYLNDEQFKITEYKKTAAGILTEEEFVQGGSIDFHVYLSYLKGIGGLPTVLVLLIGLIIGRGAEVSSHLWLSYWSDHRATIRGYPTGIGILSLLSFLQVFFFIIYFATFGISSTFASTKIHSNLIRNLLKAPVSFFDANPLGRIVNRISKDISTIDQALYSTLAMYGKQLAIVLGTFIAICYATPFFAIFCVPIFIFYWSVQRYYIPTSRQLQRIDSVLKSPIFAHISSTLNGVTTIRAFRYQENFRRENHRRLDDQQKAYILLVGANRWLATRLEFVGTLILIFSSSFVLFKGFHNNISNGVVGIVVTYALNISQSLNWMVRMASESAINIVAVERVDQYLYNIPQEEKCDIHSFNQEKQLEDWPQTGCIRFVNFSLRYRHDLPFILKSLNFTINAKNKVGVVGRTGAGKSSLLLALMRIVEASEGQIFVDDVDISQLPLKTLRSNFSIIPQDPVLFRGSMRFNLDPFHVYSDPEIWHCLKEAHLEIFVRDVFPGGLNGIVDENGQNLSQGQRQLVCLARALVRHSKILLLDEATSSVDTVTDRCIQDTIRTAFKDRTILTIAHRLVTVMDYDKILVLDQGSLVEYDSPKRLLDPNISPIGLFRHLYEKDQIEPH